MKIPKFLRFNFRRLPPPTRNKRKPQMQSATCGGMGERELQLRMELMLENFISDRNSQIFASAKQLSAFSMSEQEHFFNSAERLAKHSQKLAYQFCINGVTAIPAIPNHEEWDKWMTAIETQMHNKGEDAAIKYLQNFDNHLKITSLPPHSVTLKKITPIIEHLITALGGRQLIIQEGENAFTDTEKIYLPKSCSIFSDEDKNFAFYKATAIFLWAQTRFGTWRVDIPRLLYDLRDFDKAVALFQILENLRLDACIEKDLPGVARIITQLGKQSDNLPDDAIWQQAAQKLAQADATSEDSLEMIKSLYHLPTPQSTKYQGVFKPTDVMRAMRNRIANEHVDIQEKFSKIAKKTSPLEDEKSLVLEIQHGKSDIYKFTISHDGEQIKLTDENKKLLESIIQDFGEIPEEYLHINIDTEPKQQEDEIAQEQNSSTLLPEWDHSIQRYRTDWCHVFLRDVPDGDQDFINKTLKKHSGLVKQLRRTFEALREDDVLHRREPYGNDIDMDAATAAYISMQRLEEPSSNIYINRKNTSRNIAVAFIVDMSSSTSGWINETEKQALVLLCESLEVLGDRYAIYGFSGRTRKRCDIFKIKSFTESYNDKIKKRISGINPQNYTRMGAAIRFVRDKLLHVDAKTKIMITISDGHPDDRDGYRGRYGIEDTRRALLETSCQGIHPYCITIDTKAMDYLPYMYGRANFSIIDNVEKLPFQVSNIYRRITT